MIELTYIDFGNHPGMDRLPREAAINGCCIMTGVQGAADNEIDIPIPRSYKFDETKHSLEDIIKRIREILLNYDEHVNSFALYRERIIKEESEFYKQINQLFQL